MGDINVDNFEKVDASNERYPSMFATIVNGDGLIIYDSLDSANMNKNIADFMVKTADQTAIKDRMSKGETFELTITYEGQRMVQFFNPIHAGSETGWSMSSVSEADMNEALTTTVLWLLVLSVLSILITLVILVPPSRRRLCRSWRRPSRKFPTRFGTMRKMRTAPIRL